MTQIKVNHNLHLTTYDQSFNEVYSRCRSLETTNIQDPQDWSSKIYNMLNSFNTPHLACSSHPPFQNYTTTSSLIGLSLKLTDYNPLAHLFKLKFTVSIPPSFIFCLLPSPLPCSIPQTSAGQPEPG